MNKFGHSKSLRLCQIFHHIKILTILLYELFIMKLLFRYNTWHPLDIDFALLDGVLTIKYVHMEL